MSGFRLIRSDRTVRFEFQNLDLWEERTRELPTLEVWGANEKQIWVDSIEEVPDVG